MENAPRVHDLRVIEAMPGLVVVVEVSGPEFIIAEVSRMLVRELNTSRDQLIGKDIFTIFPEAARSAEFIECFESVLRNKQVKSASLPMVLGTSHSGSAQWRIACSPLNEGSNITHIICTLQREIADASQATKVSAMKGIESAYRFFMSAPVIIGYLSKDNFIIELANEGLLRVWQKAPDVIGQPLFDVFPEMEAQGIRELLYNVMATGNPFYAHAFPITFKRDENEETLYFDFVYQPFYEQNGIASGIISVGYDVTLQVIAKNQIEQSEKKWRDLANTMPVFVWTADEQGAITFLNDRWYDFTGLTEDQSLQSGWVKAIHPDDLDKCVTQWTEAVQKRSLYKIDFRCKSRSGEYRWMIARGVPIVRDDHIEAWYGTTTDIHEQKQLEKDLEQRIRDRTSALEVQNHLLDNILKHSSNGISVSKMIFDNDRNVVDAQTILANDSAIKFIGIPKDLYLTKTATSFDPNIISTPYGQACIKTLQTGEPFIMQYFLEYSGRWLELTVSKMDDAHLIHIFTDVTPIKDAQLKLEKSLEELKYSNANLEEFAYAASHDLKEPVRKIQFFSNRLSEELKPLLKDEQRTMFERLENSSRRMDNLIHDLLEYSQAAKGSSEKEEIDLNEKMQGVFEDLELEIQKKQAVIQVSNLPVINGNRRQIQQLFQNLISNALKYAKPNEIPQIAIEGKTVKGREVGFQVPSSELDKTFYLITVKDNGIGFDQADADRIFRVFTRLHGNFQYKGSGVGLSIVKKVVEGHHGFVWANSVPGQGSIFSVLLPV